MIKYVKLIAFAITALLMPFELYSEISKSSEYLKYVDEIVEDFTKSMKKKYQLHCYGSGGSMPTDVAEIDVLFISYKKLTVDEARKMQVDAIQELLRGINSHEKIRPFLREYPFGSDRVHIAVSFRTKTDDRPIDGSVAHVSIVKNKIYYDAAEMRMSAPVPFTYVNKNNESITKIIPGELEEELIPLMDEPYEEALKLVSK